MTLDQFVQQFTDAIQAEPASVCPETRLTGLAEFDSMGRLSVLSMIDARFGFVVPIEQLDRSETVRDLFEYAQQRGTRNGNNP